MSDQTGFTSRKERQEEQHKKDHPEDYEPVTFDNRAAFVDAAVSLVAGNHALQRRAWLEGDQVAREQMDADTGQLVIRSAADIQPERVSWVLNRRLPRGVLALSAGKGGAGKSAHAVWTAAQLTNGTLDGCWKGKPKTVVWATLEASAEKEIVPRLIAAGADLNRVKFVTVESDDNPANDHIRIFGVTHIGELEKLVDDEDVGVIVLDPLLDVLDGKVKTNDQMEVRRALGPYQTFAEMMNILILGIVHLNKMTTVDDALDRITGSAAFSQRVRAALVFAYNEVDDCYVMSQGKNNWGPLRQPNMSFTLRPVMINGGIETIRLVWSEQESKYSVNDLLGGQHKRPQKKQEHAMEWLEGELRAGPVLRSVIEAHAAAEGEFSVATLERAAKELGVQSIKQPEPLRDKGSSTKRGAPGVLWSLPAKRRNRG